MKLENLLREIQKWFVKINKYRRRLLIRNCGCKYTFISLSERIRIVLEKMLQSLTQIVRYIKEILKTEKKVFIDNSNGNILKAVKYLHMYTICTYNLQKHSNVGVCIMS